jgi:hypothetical protein
VRRLLAPTGLGLLAAAGALGQYVVAVLAPDLGAALGIGASAVVAVVALQWVGVAVFALPVSGVARTGRMLTGLAVAGGAITAGAVAAAAVIGDAWQLAAAMIAASVGGALARVSHPALLAAAGDAGERVRTFAGYRAVAAGGALAAPGAVWLLVGHADLNWRGALLATAAIAAGAAGLGATLLALGAAGRTAQTDRAPAGGVRPAAMDIARGLLRVPTVARALPAFAIAGAFAAPLPAELSFFLEDRWHLGRDGRGAVYAASAAVTIVALALLAATG